jgi:hypothetical protein
MEPLGFPDVDGCRICDDRDLVGKEAILAGVRRCWNIDDLMGVSVTQSSYARELWMALG